MADDTSALTGAAIIHTIIFTVLKMLLIPSAADVIHGKITRKYITKIALSCGFTPSKSQLTDNQE